MDHPKHPAKPRAHSPQHRQRLEQAVARYHRPLVSYARSLTGDLERARDAAQDALLRLCQQPAEDYDQKISHRLGAWLFTVCRNRVIDLHRKEHRMTATDNQSLDSFVQQRSTSGSTSGGPADHAEAHDQQDHLLRLVDALPPNQREVVQLRFRGELAYREIAEVTGHSVSHVGVLLHSAMKHLRKDMAELNA